MTIAIAAKVNDGIVLATDSTTTLVQTGQVLNTYNNANKVFNLVKTLPLGATTWGTGNIGRSSISALMKDFRDQLTKDFLPDKQEERPSYTVQEVARRLRTFFYEDRYLTFHNQFPEFTHEDTGFLVAGYSVGSDLPEAYEVQIVGGQSADPVLRLPLESSGVVWNGQPEALVRFVLGFSPSWIGPVMEQFGIPGERLNDLVEVIKTHANFPLAVDAMPIQDAIELAQFLVELATNASRFWPGTQTIGGPVEIAAITKHEGFKWVRRKHYFSRDLNPDLLH